MPDTTASIRLEALEERIQLLEDQEAIRECFARYGFTADLGHSQAWADVWTEDGVYELFPTSIVRGKERLLHDIITNNAGHKKIENRSQHTAVNHYIRVNGDKAWAEGYSIVYTKKDVGVSAPGSDGQRSSTNVHLSDLESEMEGYQAWICCYNHWEFERHEGRWLMKHRNRRPIGGDEWGGAIIKGFLEE